MISNLVFNEWKRCSWIALATPNSLIPYKHILKGNATCLLNEFYFMGHWIHWKWLDCFFFTPWRLIRDLGLILVEAMRSWLKSLVEQTWAACSLHCQTSSKMDGLSLTLIYWLNVVCYLEDWKLILGKRNGWLI